MDTQVFSLVWRALSKFFKDRALGLAICAVASAMIPTSVIMTDEELREHKQLPLSEIFIRKGFVGSMIFFGATMPSTVKGIASGLKDPKIANKAIAASTALMLAPGFVAAFKAAVKTYKGEKLTAKPGDYTLDNSPISMGTVSLLGTAGVAAGTTAVAMQALKSVPKPPAV